LVRQIEVIKPDVIVCLGRFAAKFIFERFGIQFTSISRVRGKIFEGEKWEKKVRIVPLYHPAAILYRPQLKEEYENEFRRIGKLLKKKNKQPTLMDFL
jgi:DNA polymerase